MDITISFCVTLIFGFQDIIRFVCDLAGAGSAGTVIRIPSKNMVINLSFYDFIRR